MNVKYKCIFCGEVFDAENAETIVCPKCNSELGSDRAEKYYLSMTNTTPIILTTAEARRDASIKVNEGLDLVDMERLDEAKIAFSEALKLNGDNYLANYGYALVLTDNWTDYDDNSHEQYIEKSFSKCDNAQRAPLAKKYSTYLKKRRMSFAERKEFEREELDNEYKLFRKKLKSSEVDFLIKEKKRKTFTILLSVFLFVSLALFACGLIFSNAIILVLSFPFFCAAYVFFHFSYNYAGLDKVYKTILRLNEKVLDLDLNESEVAKLFHMYEDVLDELIGGAVLSTLRLKLEDIGDYMWDTGKERAISYAAELKLIKVRYTN